MRVWISLETGPRNTHITWLKASESKNSASTSWITAAVLRLNAAPRVPQTPGTKPLRTSVGRIFWVFFRFFRGLLVILLNLTEDSLRFRYCNFPPEGRTFLPQWGQLSLQFTSKICQFFVWARVSVVEITVIKNIKPKSRIFQKIILQNSFLCCFLY